jgi:hypothetical protein
MKRRLFGAVALTCLFVAFAAPVAEGDPGRSAPMQFALRQEGPAASCADKCRIWISATGMIRPDTVRDFEALAEKHNLRGLTLALNSEGGSVHGAIALGRAIRRLDMMTTVGRTIEMPGKAGQATLSPRADCESMCAFVLLAGSRRVVPNEARVRVHQIWLGDRRDDATAAVYSAEDLVLVQRDIGKLAQYTVEMGGGVELLELSLRIPPWEPMRALTRDEVRRMHLDNSDVAELPAPQPAAVTGPVPPAATNSAPTATGFRRVANNSERGWSMVERTGAMVLVRRHPLTVEGDDLGHFDVMFACGDSANEFVVGYSETRRSRNGEALQPLKEIAVRIGSRTLPLSLAAARMKLAAGPAKPGPTALASGIIPASLLKTFGNPGSRSLTIETSTIGKESTIIRIGNTGVAQHLPRLAAACASQPRVEHARLFAQD